MGDGPRRAPSRVLHSVTVALLDAVVTVRSDDAEVIGAVAELYAETADASSPEHCALLVGSDVDGAPGRVVTVDGSVVVRTPAAAIAFTNLVFELNQLAIRSTRGVRLHAGAVATADGAVIVAGSMGAGKSTLTAGLVRRGARYLTDEVVAFTAGSDAVRPYAKPLSLSRPPAELRDLWRPGPATARLLGATGLVPPAAVGAVATRPVPVRAVVLPRYEPGATTEVARLGPAESLTEVASHTFALESPGTLAALADRLDGLPVWSMVSGDLGSACAAVADRIGDVRG